MSQLTSLHFHPEKAVRLSLLTLALATLGFTILLWPQQEEVTAFPLQNCKQETIATPAYNFSLGLKEEAMACPVPALQEEMTFSLDPPRPDGKQEERGYLVRLNRSAESKHVTLPCRLDLEFQAGKLKFAKAPSLFWVELTPNLEGSWWIQSPDSTDHGSFPVKVVESPLRTAVEFAEGTAFRALAEARWWGRDLLSPGTNSERLQFTDAIDLSVGEWLVWKEGRWEKGSIQESLPIARIAKAAPKELILEAWDAEGHIRILLTPATLGTFKMKTEELFSSVRVRSEKQISCVLEKQGLVLKVGDWVLKQNGRWKILRKKEDRDLFLQGKRTGELLMLEQIAQKGGQKVIQGRFICPRRVEQVPFELAMQGSRKEKKGKK